MPSFLYAAPQPSRLDARVLFDRLADGLLEQGGIALRPLQSALQPSPGRHPDPRNASALRLLLEEGYLEQDVSGGTELRVGLRGVRRCEELSLLELFGPGGGNQPGSHLDGSRSTGPEAGDEPRPHVPGEPLDHLDLSATLASAL